MARGRVGRIITRRPDEVDGADVWKVHRGDDDLAGLVEAFSGLDRVFLMSTPDEPEVRIRRHRNAIDAAKAAGVHEISFLSLHDSVPPGDTIRHDRCIDMPFGDGRAGWVTRDDIARTVAAAMDDRFVAGGHFAITGPASLGAASIAEMLSRHVGEEIRYDPMTLDEYRAGLEAAGLPPVTAAAFTGLCEAIASQRFDIVTSTVADVTGYAPVSLDDVLGDIFRESL